MYYGHFHTTYLPLPCPEHIFQQVLEYVWGEAWGMGTQKDKERLVAEHLATELQ